MTVTNASQRGVFARLRECYDDDSIVELTAIIAWETASSNLIGPASTVATAWNADLLTMKPPPSSCY